MPRILTPGGYRDSSMVHRIPSGQKLCFDRDHYVIRDRHTGSPTKAVVPGTLAPAAAVDSGWKAYSYWTNDSGLPIKSMTAQFTVPEIPTSIGPQTIFLFPGIQNLDDNIGILQPVLQFGPSALGGGPFWSIASWYVPTTGEAFHSDQLTPVAPGTQLVGRMSLTGASGGTFSYSSAFDGIIGSECFVEGIEELKWCNLTLEAYEVSEIEEYPSNGPTIFKNVRILAAAALANVAWQVPLPSSLGEAAKVVDASATNGQVSIAY